MASPCTLAIGVLCLVAVAVQANEVLVWNELALDTYVENTNYFPTPVRNHAILHTAISKALKNLGCHNTDCNTAVGNLTIAHAAHYVLKTLYINDQNRLDVIMKNYYETYTDPSVRSTAKHVGEKAARDIIHERSKDELGSFDYKVMPVGSTADYPLRTCPLNEILGLNNLQTYNQWATARMWNIPSTSHFYMPPPPPSTSALFEHDYNETCLYGSQFSTLRTEDESQLAIFHDAGFGSETATGTISRMAAEIIKQTGTKEYDSSVILSLLAQSVHDIFGIAIYWKGYYETERPWSMCRLGLASNPTLQTYPDWNPFIRNPCGGEYPGGHSTAAGVGYRLLELLFDRGDFTFTVESSQTSPVIYPRTFHSLREFCDEAVRARMFAGLHFDFSNVAGRETGIEVAEYVFNKECKKRKCLKGH